MANLQDSVAETLAIRGVRSVALVDEATGAVAKWGGAALENPDSAPSLIAAAEQMAHGGRGRAFDELDCILAMTERGYVILRVIPVSTERLIFYAEFDREEVNVGLVVSQTKRIANSLLV
ncbi:hypothetical protein AB0N17_44480 [Streptomyces sp. NPDC051133]|uniref:hypothetical protein n=1 Tax=Streptomyces sp. NPDC051133 TaxID=3155521 RepID=UPI00341DFE47